ncbi:hypothetical protein P4H65_09370 [Paenibacillus chitinolyticus]|uniref:hypothetical protein n=1 Tax=Paenibacillus chitinolyticus TaxID=79263 RepID=UPI002DBF4480|nr:hypothetical protein [Paenibacillus chitinolyticus]MEC0245994.1 hypothetical protein [Paenibacillus chitinolyticus]
MYGGYAVWSLPSASTFSLRKWYSPSIANPLCAASFFAINWLVALITIRLGVYSEMSSPAFSVSFLWLVMVTPLASSKLSFSGSLLPPATLTAVGVSSTSLPCSVPNQCRPSACSIVRKRNNKKQVNHGGI